ncbi:immunoglobulin domain-containing protein [uncultured Aeromicrobium sp.]|uniref:immunoglobulin domain-containing protein n=1 Tax=uncultured Aeromicrobium sp. TaxID=337820 RepID=UPI0025FAC4F5|nr:immunoglobulin domain-containing protein [uncultured Aeromicrobium sp.]
MTIPRPRRIVRRSCRAALVAATIGALASASLLPAAAEPAPATPLAAADPTVTVTPNSGLSPEGESTLTLNGSGFATSLPSGLTFGGAYILFGTVTPTNPADPDSWAPSKRGVSGTNYDYAPGAGTYQTMVGYPGYSPGPGEFVMDENGDWNGELVIPGPYFESQAGHEINCFDVQCGVITIGAHGQVNEGVETFTPVTFSDGEEGVAPQFTSDPVSVSVVEGETASFEVEVTGDPAPELQWQRAEEGSEDWTDIPDATSATLTLPNVTLDDNGTRYRAQATNTAGTTTSAAATLTVTTAPATPPTGEPRVPEDDELSEATAGSVEFVSYKDGVLTLRVDEELADSWVGVSLHPAQLALGWHLVSADGLITAEVELDPDEYRAAVTAEDGTLVGWTSFEVTPVDNGDGNGGGGNGPGNNPGQGGGGNGPGNNPGQGGQGGGTGAGSQPGADTGSGGGKLPGTGTMVSLGAILAALAAIAAGAMVRRRQAG